MPDLPTALVSFLSQHCLQGLVPEDADVLPGDERAQQGADPKAVVVFEEVDSLAEQDRGFLSAVASLVADTKVLRMSSLFHHSHQLPDVWVTISAWCSKPFHMTRTKALTCS